MVRKVTVNQNECVIVTTGALVTSSATSNIDNFLLLSMDSTRGPKRKKKEERKGEHIANYKQFANKSQRASYMHVNTNTLTAHSHCHTMQDMMCTIMQSSRIHVKTCSYLTPQHFQHV